MIPERENCHVAGYKCITRSIGSRQFVMLRQALTRQRTSTKADCDMLNYEKNLPPSELKRSLNLFYFKTVLEFTVGHTRQLQCKKSDIAFKLKQLPLNFVSNLQFNSIRCNFFRMLAWQRSLNTLSRWRIDAGSNCRVCPALVYRMGQSFSKCLFLNYIRNIPQMQCFHT